MISQTVEYALRAMVTLAYRAGDAMTVQEIAEVTRVPAPYLSKLMQGMVRSGLLKSRRGLGGGFTLSRSPEGITMWDILQAVDPLKRIHTCPLEIEGHRQLCPLHRRVDAALEGVESAFKGTTLAELIAESGTDSPLCTRRSNVVELSVEVPKPPNESGK